MNKENRALVRESIEGMENNINDISQSFYRELLLTHPGFSSIFSGNVEALNTKFFNMVAVFKNVKHLESISASVEEIGKRHFIQYAVKPSHLKLIKPVLMQVLKKHLGNRFETRVHDAWVSVFDEVADIFLKSAPSASCRDVDSSPRPGRVLDVDLLEKIGGRDVIFSIHTEFYRKIFEHPLLGQFFRGKHEDVLARKQTDFMVAAFGGENRYAGDTPAFVHMHMYITQEQLVLREALLRESIENAGVDKHAIDCWLDIDRRFWPGIAKKSLDECVLKCQGQVPIVAKQ